MADLAASVASNMVTLSGPLQGRAGNVQQLQGVLTTLPTAVRTAVGAFEALTLALDTATKAAQAAQERLDGILKIAQQARSAAVGTTFLQGLLGQAKDLRIEVSSLEGMLRRARAASTISLGQGKDAPRSAVRERLDLNVRAGNLRPGALDRFDGARDQEQRIQCGSSHPVMPKMARRSRRRASRGGGSTVRTGIAGRR